MPNIANMNEVEKNSNIGVDEDAGERSILVDNGLGEIGKVEDTGDSALLDLHRSSSDREPELENSDIQEDSMQAQSAEVEGELLDHSSSTDQQKGNGVLLQAIVDSINAQSRKEISEDVNVSNAPPMDAIDRALSNQPISYSSDEEEDNSDSDRTGVNETTGSSSSDEDLGSATDDNVAEGDSSSDSDSDSESSESEKEPVDQQRNKRSRRSLQDAISDDEDDGSNGPLRTKNEVVDAPAPELPGDFTLTPEMAIEYVGELSRVVEKSAIVQAAVSGEFRILQENSILCFEDRTILGVLYDTFGRIQLPFYTVKFNEQSKLEDIKTRLGQRVFYVVSASSFLLTDQIKVKGSDASNLHDEEIPEEEQEYSDDEKEMANKPSKKKKKKPKTKTNHEINNSAESSNAKRRPQQSTNYNNNNNINNNNNGLKYLPPAPSFNSTATSYMPQQPYQAYPWNPQQPYPVPMATYSQWNQAPMYQQPYQMNQAQYYSMYNPQYHPQQQQQQSQYPTNQPPLPYDDEYKP